MKKKRKKKNIIIKSFKYRAYANRGTTRRAIKTMLFMAANIWNPVVREKNEDYEKWKKDKNIKTKRFCSYGSVRKSDHPEYKNYNAQSMECQLKDYDWAYKSFLELQKKGYEDAMPPGERRIRPISYRQSGYTLVENNLHVKNIGRFKLRLHRPIEGERKRLTITRKNGKFYVSFACEVIKNKGACSPVSAKRPFFIPFINGLRQEYAPPGGGDPEKSGTYNHEPPITTAKLGGGDPEKSGTCRIKFGHEDGDNDIFLIDSEGRTLLHPQFYFSEIKKLKKLSRSLSRKKKGSKNRRKAKWTLAKWHERIKNKRDYFMWNVARFFALNYKSIEIPELPLKMEIQYTTDSKKARQLCDAAYGKFTEMLKHKCNELGTKLLIRKDPKWQKEIKKLIREKKALTRLEVLLRRSKRAVKGKDLNLLSSLERDRKRVETLQT